MFQSLLNLLTEKFPAVRKHCKKLLSHGLGFGRIIFIRRTDLIHIVLNVREYIVQLCDEGGDLGVEHWVEVMLDSLVNLHERSVVRAE
jgi:hypothetical protein